MTFRLNSSNAHFRNCVLFLVAESLDQLEEDRERRDGEMQRARVTRVNSLRDLA